MREKNYFPLRVRRGGGLKNNKKIKLFLLPTFFRQKYRIKYQKLTSFSYFFLSLQFIFSAALVGCIIAYPQFNPYSPIPPKFVPIGPSSPAPIRFAPAGPSSPIPVPIASRQYAEAGKDQNARVVSEYRDVNFDGTFNYG